MAGFYEGKKVLVADEDTDVNSAICEWLRGSFSGVEFLCAYDGMEAERLALRENPDVMILEMILPKRLGSEVLKRLKKGKPLESKPHVVVVTSYYGERYKECAVRYGIGIKDYFLKPFRIKDLTDSVKRGFEI